MSSSDLWCQSCNVGGFSQGISNCTTCGTVLSPYSAGTGGQFIDQKRGMGSKIKGAFHDIKTAIIGDRHAQDLRQEQIDSTILPTGQFANQGMPMQG